MTDHKPVYKRSISWGRSLTFHSLGRLYFRERPNHAFAKESRKGRCVARRGQVQEIEKALLGVLRKRERSSSGAISGFQENPEGIAIKPLCFRQNTRCVLDHSLREQRKKKANEGVAEGGERRRGRWSRCHVSTPSGPALGLQSALFFLSFSKPAIAGRAKNTPQATRYGQTLELKLKGGKAGAIKEEGRRKGEGRGPIT